MGKPTPQLGADDGGKTNRRRYEHFMYNKHNNNQQPTTNNQQQHFLFQETCHAGFSGSLLHGRTVIRGNPDSSLMFFFNKSLQPPAPSEQGSWNKTVDD